ncbi:rhomboid family protein [Nitzschia inconspicua]|uniref:Rhomboid family protein n=1 Tax=Nitzschia inconspicua TaxID=303405 RepID=A0A9K3Q8H5_9STRA|nr:rhomboid family protein [Nitzschia inconspicua]
MKTGRRTLVSWITVAVAVVYQISILVPVCHADLPTEALEALGRKHEREFKKKDTKRNREKAAREMVIEHPGTFFWDEEGGGVELNPEYNKYNNNNNKNNNNNNQRKQNKKQQSSTRMIEDDFILFQQFHHQQHRQYKQQQGMEFHDQMLMENENVAATSRRPSNQRNVPLGGGIWFQRPSSSRTTTTVDPVPPIMQSLHQYFQSMKQNSPATFGTTIACAIVFVLWQIVPSATWLQTYFVCSRQSFIQSHGLSLLLSTVSHSSLRHLTVNLLLLFHLAPKMWSNSSHIQELPSRVRATTNNNISPQAAATITTRSTPPLWPLLLGSSLFTNGLFVAIRRTKTCLGLSGVVMALMAYYYGGGIVDASQPLEFWIGGILPISIRPRPMIRILCGISLLGSFSTRSTIAHLVHLGGLIFGLLYYHVTTIHHLAQRANNSKALVEKDEQPKSSEKNQSTRLFGLWRRTFTSSRLPSKNR